LENVCDRLAVSLLDHSGIADLHEDVFRELCPELFDASAFLVEPGPIATKASPIKNVSNGKRLPPARREAAARQALEKHRGHVGSAADELGISRVTLWRWSKGTV
jgi:transcriptional regulator of acetoin/glycerol metabolism